MTEVRRHPISKEPQPPAALSGDGDGDDAGDDAAAADACLPLLVGVAAGEFLLLVVSVESELPLPPPLPPRSARFPHARRFADEKVE